MEHEYIGWSAMIIPGAILGLFFRPKVSGIIVFSVLVLSVVGSIGAAFLQLIKAEWLLLLMGALPAAGIIFGAAVLSNVLRNVLKH